MYRALTQQERADFERAQCVLLEQQAAQERIELESLEPEERDALLRRQVQLRLARWIIRTGIETNQADFDLLDALCERD